MNFFDVCPRAIELLAERIEDHAGALGELALKPEEDLVDGPGESVKGTRPRGPCCARPGRLERCSGARSQPRSLEAIGSLKEPEEAAGFAQGERLRAEGQRRGDLLLALKKREGVDDARAKEPLGEDLVDLRVELLEDLVAALGPARLSSQPPGDGSRGKLLLTLDGGEDLELLPERRAPPGIVAYEPLEPSLDPAPGLNDHPGRLSFRGKQGEVALESVHEDEVARVLQDDEGVVDVDGARAVVALEELERDLSQGHLP